MYRMISSPLNVVLYLNPTACMINFSKNNLEHWCIKIPPFFNYYQLIYCLLFLVSLYIIKFVIHIRNYFTLLVYEITCNVLFQSSAKLLKKREEERFVNLLLLSCLMNGWVVNDVHQTSVMTCIRHLSSVICQTGFLVTYKNGDFDAISVTEQSCKVESHVSE